MRTSLASAGVLLCALGLSACADTDTTARTSPTTAGDVSSPASSPSPSPGSTPAPPPASPSAPTTAAAPTPAGPQVSDGAPRTAYLSVPAIGLRALEVVPYVGRTDDGPGTEIQDDGDAASPHGPEGGTGPGGVGNYQVTAHRNTAGGPFFDLPDLAVGERVLVTAGDTTYVYRVTETRETSFRSPESLRAQRAAVPGQPGVTPTQAALTLSTCATQEDHAEGNYWSDEFDNPEHRIDKVAVLVATRPA